MLRTPFMDGGQTPLGWTIANSPGNLLGNLGSYSAIVLPNMLRTLRTWSVRGLGLDSKAATKDLYDSVAESCCKVNNNSLYQYFNPSAQPIPNVLGSNYRMQLSGKAVFRFDIYKFDTQMSTERKIDLRLLFLGKVSARTLPALSKIAPRLPRKDSIDLSGCTRYGLGPLMEDHCREIRRKAHSSLSSLQGCSVRSQ
ncbi:hypothetical protein BKA70DRAFT_407166 [Coprinopsis sp. MPI-PUGE-AT-0042]|nr:hypothetical protein BKA70DRAFT_407166 [Coprinopsis sp. MPI-PUGE-AT-0042]